ncbi:MAG: exodeoxyribonuclease VII small subunit [Lachnospiraceae bacterium]|jgi:exodeoxyribonuclease VII small subunit|nr:exodeoxyribonuclease VII small subunit [Lachnospiraceae bacterium]
MSLEKTIGKLEATLNTLEREDISLEEAFKEYQKGVMLVKECNAMIDKMEKEVMILDEDEEAVRYDE